MSYPDMNNVVLYHGTTAELMPKLVTNGLLPDINSNFDGTHGQKSLPGRVYLTDHLPGFYSHLRRKETGKNWLTLEIPLSEDLKEKLWPDEDFMVQYLSGPSIKARLAVAEHRARNPLPEDRQHWEASLIYTGTVAHLGAIPWSAVSRVSSYDPGSDQFIADAFTHRGSLLQSELIEQGLRECFQALTRWLFLEPTNWEEVEKAFESTPPEPRLTELRELLENPAAIVLNASDAATLQENEGV